MKILYLVHQFYPERGAGTEKFVYQLAQQCQSADHEVKVVTYDAARLSATNPAMATLAAGKPKQAFKRTLKIKLQRVGIELVQLRNELVAKLPNRILSRTYLYQNIPVVAYAHQQRLIRPGSPIHSQQLRSFARELLEHEQPDILHVGHLLRGTEFVEAAVEMQLPYLLTLTDFWVICPNCKLITEGKQICHGPRHGETCRQLCPSESQKGLARRLIQMQQVLQGAAAIVTPSHFLANKVREEFGELPITVIPYGIDMPHLQRNSRHYPSPKPLTFLFAGTLYLPKGIHLLLQAFERLTEPNIRLQVYGGGPFEEMVRQQAALDPRINFCGRYTIEQLGNILEKVDVVIVPSVWHENLPLIMQEAQACGVPTLVSDVGGMTECVTDGVNGLTFRVGDVADLQRKMQMIIEQPEILNGIKENIGNPKPRQYRVTSLSEEATLYLQEYRKILGQPSARL